MKYKVIQGLGVIGFNNNVNLAVADEWIPKGKVKAFVDGTHIIYYQQFYKKESPLNK